MRFRLLNSTAAAALMACTGLGLHLNAQAEDWPTKPVVMVVPYSAGGPTDVVARMLELLLEGRDRPLGRVLEVGTGCGYQAAVLSRLCAEVYTIERLKGLHEKARELLRPFRIANVHLLLGDGMLGFASGAPYDGIVAAAGGESIPPAWTDQLAVGGRLVAPAHMGTRGQSLVVVERTPKGLAQTVLEAVQFVPLKSGIA